MSERQPASRELLESGQRDKVEKILESLTTSPVLFVNNFDLRTTSDDISEFIARWGETEKVELFYDEHTKRHKGYCLVTYKSLDVAKTALQESGKFTLQGRKIYFNLSKQHLRQSQA